MVDPFLPDTEKVAAIRELLPATGAGIYLDAASAGPFPAETAEALAEADAWELRVGRTGPGREEDTAQRVEEARSVIAALLGGDPDGVVLTHGARDSISRLRSGLGVGADALRVAPLVDGATGAFVPVDSPVLDVSFAAGAVPLDLEGVDAVVLDGHRWLLGPEGVGALWVGPRLRALVDPDVMSRTVEGPPRRSVLGLARSVGWIEMYVGLPWIHDRTASLVAHLSDALGDIEGVDLVTPRTAMAAIVTFSIRGWRAAEAQDELSRRAFAIVAIEPGLEAIKASVGFWNTPDELTRFADAVRELAAHTPDTLPRRPSLVVLDGPDRGPA